MPALNWVIVNHSWHYAFGALGVVGLMWCAALCGGTLLQAADLLSRWLIRPAELPVGVLTACLGGAYLLVLMWRRGQQHG